MPSVASESAWRRWRADNPDVGGLKVAFQAGFGFSSDPQEELRVPYMASRMVEQKADILELESKLERVTAERDELLRRVEGAQAALVGDVVKPVDAEPFE